MRILLLFINFSLNISVVVVSGGAVFPWCQFFNTPFELPKWMEWKAHNKWIKDFVRENVIRHKLLLLWLNTEHNVLVFFFCSSSSLFFFLVLVQMRFLVLPYVLLLFWHNIKYPKCIWCNSFNFFVVGSFVRCCCCRRRRISIDYFIPTLSSCLLVVVGAVIFSTFFSVRLALCPFLAWVFIFVFTACALRIFIPATSPLTKSTHKMHRNEYSSG